MLVNNTEAHSSAPANSRTRILDQAEALFASRGLAAVTLRDIASPLGLRHSALYYHFPGGKEELYAAVTERNVRRHGEGLEAALEAGGPELRGRLEGAAGWLLSQPPMDLIRMVHSDLKALSPEVSGRIMELVYTLMMRRLQEAFETARESGAVGECDPGLLAGGFLGLVESLHAAPPGVTGRKAMDMARDLIGILLRGIGYGETQGGRECR